MKGIKQLEKEIKELKHKVSENIGKVDEININVWDDQTKWKEIQLQTLQEVCDEIEKLPIHTREIRNSKSSSTIIKSIDKQELLKKFQGEEE